MQEVTLFQRSESPPITYPYPLFKSEDERLKAMALKPNQVGSVILYGERIISLVMDGKERLCLAQISNTLLKDYSYNEIHNRRVALGITCVQCTPVQLEILRRAGAMPISSRRCGMITKREAERLCKSFLGDNAPPKLPDNFAFEVQHECAWGCRGQFVPSRYNSSRAKCIKCHFCNVFFSPNKFVFHSHRMGEGSKYIQPDAANFNSWRRHTKLYGDPPEAIVFAWEDIKAMFNGGSRKRILGGTSSSSPSSPFPSCPAKHVALVNENPTVPVKSSRSRKRESKPQEFKKSPAVGNFQRPQSGLSLSNLPQPCSKNPGHPRLDLGFEGRPCEPPSSTPFDHEKIAFAAALAAAATNNSKGLADYLWSPQPIHSLPFWPKRNIGMLQTPFLFGDTVFNSGFHKQSDLFRPQDLKLQQPSSPGATPATSGFLHWMEQRQRYSSETFNPLMDNVSESTASAFRPVLLKPHESLSEFIRRGQQLNYAGSLETGCSEVSTTVDKDDPIESKKIEEEIDLETTKVLDDSPETETKAKNLFKDFSVQNIVSGETK